MFWHNDIASNSTNFSDKVISLTNNYDLCSLYDLIQKENMPFSSYNIDFLKIILKINIIFYLPKNKLVSKLQKYEELSSYQDTCYLKCILYFLPYIQKSKSFEFIKTKAFKSLVSILNIISFITEKDNLHSNQDYNYLYYLHEEMVYYILSFNKFKSFISCFDKFMDSSKLQYEYKNEMTNHLLMNDFVKSWTIDFGNQDIAQAERPISKKVHFPNFHVIKKTDASITNGQGNINGLCNKKKVRLDVKEVKNYKFTALKRETIDKVTITYFRKYLKNSKLDKENEEFVRCFILGYYTPPFEYNGLFFKSGNASYLCWFFNNERIKIHYENFIEAYYNQLVSKIVLRIKPEKEELLLLKEYLFSMTKIYS